MGRRRKPPTVFIFIVALFLLGGCVWSIVQDKTSDKVFKEVPGTIVDIEETTHVDNEREYRVYVDYSLNHKDYKHVEYGSYNSSMKIGDKVTVRYNVDDPSEIRAPGAEKVAYIVGAMGLLLLLYGIYTVLRKH